jgi:hypothetical protein
MRSQVYHACQAAALDATTGPRVQPHPVAITLDDSAYPIILQGFPAGPKTEAALRDLFQRMSVVAARAVRDRTVHVVVAVGDERFTAAERRVVAECMSMATRQEAACVVGAFAVIENGFARGVLTALRWLAPHAIPVVAAATPDEAIDLARARLRDAGVIVSPDVVARAHIVARKLHPAMKHPPATPSP